MRDSEVVASIVAGDADGLAGAYDRYADPLYKYCRFLLGHPAEAADAVQDTFVIAASRLADLSEPERLRAWLYAVARNECLRSPRPRKTASAPGQAPDAADDSADAGEDAGRAALRRLLGDAAAGLNPVEREVIELQLRQGLELAEVAAVLGVSRNHAHSLLSRAREQLEARFGELRPAPLPGLSPGAAMAAAAADSLRAAAGPPAELRTHTLALAAGQDPGAAAHRAAVLSRAGSFDRHGFPLPARGPATAPARRAGARGALPSSPRGRAAVAAGAALAVVIAVTAFALDGGTQHAELAGGQPSGSAHSPTAPAFTGASAVAATRSGKGGSTAPAPSQAPATPATTPSPAATTVAAPSSPATASPATTAPPQSPTPGPATASPGTLEVFSPDGSRLWLPPYGADAVIWLTAQGGPVTWWITVSGGQGEVSVNPSSGTLAASQRVPVTITASGSAPKAKVTVYPGGTTFTVVTGWHH